MMLACSSVNTNEQTLTESDAAWIKCKHWTMDIYSLTGRCGHAIMDFMYDQPYYKHKKQTSYKMIETSTRHNTNRPSDEIVETYPTATGQCNVKRRKSAWDKGEPVVSKTERSCQVIELIIHSFCSGNCIRMVLSPWPKKQQRFVASCAVPQFSWEVGQFTM